jgi:hypothetical protein
MDCPRELVELVSRMLPLVLSSGGCDASEVAADVKTDGASAGGSSSLLILMGFATGRFFLGNFDRRGPWLGGEGEEMDGGSGVENDVALGAGADLAFDFRFVDGATSAFWTLVAFF